MPGLGASHGQSGGFPALLWGVMWMPRTEFVMHCSLVGANLMWVGWPLCTPTMPPETHHARLRPRAKDGPINNGIVFVVPAGRKGRTPPLASGCHHTATAGSPWACD